jgi:carboxyl-terminal processing protease
VQGRFFYKELPLNKLDTRHFPLIPKVGELYYQALTLLKECGILIYMNKKISVGVCISLIAIACTVAFVVTWTVSFNMYNDMIPVAHRDEINSKLQEIDAFLRNNFLGEIDDENIAFGIFSGYISGVGDKNTVYMTANEFVNHLNRESGQIVTTGIKAEPEESGYIIVAEVYPGSSAESFGVMRGDIITAVEGFNVLEIGAQTAARLLEGEENTRAVLTLQRHGQENDYSLIRQALEIVSVEHSIADDVGFVRITAFNELTALQFDAVLQEFAENEIRGLVIDMRGNSGGSYAPVPEMLSRLMTGAGEIAFTEHRGGIRRDFIATDDSEPVIESPIVIITDSFTSGAGELMAAVLKSHAGAQIVGGVTAGNSYLQQTQGLKDGSAVRVTVARIVLSCGLNYADIGLIPDYVIDNIDDTTDLQMAKAFEIIQTIIR